MILPHRNRANVLPESEIIAVEQDIRVAFQFGADKSISFGNVEQNLLLILQQLGINLMGL